MGWKQFSSFQRFFNVCANILAADVAFEFSLVH